MAAATVYQVWHESSRTEATVGSKNFDNEQDAREHASDLDEYVILSRSQETRGEDKIWTDLDVEIVDGDYWSPYLNEITDVEVDN
jgi:hypothetical protein